jgi:hypothetical protein
MVDVSRKKPLKTSIRLLMIAGGIMSVSMGVIGIVLPILPTTPFFLLAAYLFLRSSQRLYRWLLTHRIFGNYIRNYIHYKAISPWVKVFTLTLLWGTILTSVFVIKNILWLQILLLLIAVGVSVHVLSLRSMLKQNKRDFE